LKLGLAVVIGIGEWITPLPGVEQAATKSAASASTRMGFKPSQS
jgi:hypothetical protein